MHSDLCDIVPTRKALEDGPGTGHLDDPDDEEVEVEVDPLEAPACMRACRYQLNTLQVKQEYLKPKPRVHAKAKKRPGAAFTESWEPPCNTAHRKACGARSAQGSFRNSLVWSCSIYGLHAGFWNGGLQPSQGLYMPILSGNVLISSVSRKAASRGPRRPRPEIRYRCSVQINHKILGWRQIIQRRGASRPAFLLLHVGAHAHIRFRV